MLSGMAKESTSHFRTARAWRERIEERNQRLFALLFFSFLFLLSPMLATACEARLSPAAAPPAPPLRWEPVHDGLRFHAPVASIAFDPHQSRRIAIGLYAPTGLLLSEDEGEAWRKDHGLAEAVHAVRFDQILSGVLWAAGAHGLWRVDLHSEGWRRRAAIGWPADHAAF
ncbi:MAG: hypothetical protein QXT58_04390, partial [Archaeoglobaceae archaeon]